MISNQFNFIKGEGEGRGEGSVGLWMSRFFNASFKTGFDLFLGEQKRKQIVLLHSRKTSFVSCLFQITRCPLESCSFLTSKN